MLCFRLKFLSRLMKIELLISKYQCMALASIRSKDLMLHAQSLCVKVDRL